MHTAPSVRYPVGRSRFLGRAALLVWLAGAGVLTAWAMGVFAGWVTVVAAAVTVGAGGLARHWWGRQADGELAWNGTAWTWSAGLDPETRPAVSIQRPYVVLDLQKHLWLRLVQDACVSDTPGVPMAPSHVWLEQASSPDRWYGIRGAVYSRAVPAASADPAADS